MPGGESTTMTLLMERMGLLEPVGRALEAGLPVLGTCAGMILLAGRVSDGRAGQEVSDGGAPPAAYPAKPGVRLSPLGALDITVRRNAWGRQVDSFESLVDVPALEAPFPGVFIRAPRVEDTGSAEVVARLPDGEPVGVRQGRVMALSFHPELSGDPRLHREFLRLVAQP